MKAINVLKNSIYIFICLLAPMAWGQTQKKYVTEEEYEQWTSMSAANLSPDGKWAHYTLSNTHIRGLTQPDQPADTLELAELQSMKKYIYPLGTNPQFAPNNKWFSFFQNNQWVLFDLKRKTETRIDSIRSVQFALNGTVTLLRHTNQPDKLTIYNNKNKREFAINHTKDFSVSPDKENMVILQQNDSLYNLLLVDLKQPDKPTLLKEKVNNCTNFKWSNSGNLLVFYEDIKNSAAAYKDHRLHCIDIRYPADAAVLESSQLEANYYLNNHAITFTKDETSINFTAFPKDESYKPVDPVVWRSFDPVQPPAESTYHKRKVMSWNKTTDALTFISDQPYFTATGDFQHFFVLDDTNYLPSFKYGNFYNDILHINGKSGKVKLIEDEFVVLNRSDAIAPSLNETYFAWIKEKDWWIYDSNSGKKWCMTCELQDEFVIPVDPSNCHNVPYSAAFYSKDNSRLILTSKNNIWIYNLNKNTIQPLFETDKKYSYKIEPAKLEKLDSKGEAYNFFRIAPIDLQTGLFVIQYDLETNRESLYLYQNGKKIKFIASVPHKISSPRKAGSTITYTLSNYDLPPQIVYWHNGKEAVVKQSNPQQQNYYWGHSELLTYPGPYGTTLKGALFYPGNYDPSKSYPVVFRIYSDVSFKSLKKYTPLRL